MGESGEGLWGDAFGVFKEGGEWTFAANKEGMKVSMKVIVIARPIRCAVSGCKGKIVWEKQNPISVSGHCDECQAGWTLLLTQGPTWIKDLEELTTCPA